MIDRSLDIELGCIVCTAEESRLRCTPNFETKSVFVRKL